ncbi:SDR family NAD(P)-dependent oxidoreductase [Rhodococcus opacus]|uniref:3-oxoacyl-[acyl-carrier-protein] reductase MabA n=1 Tax=Rhodococcus opacus (strain B4) TaxID=632772 RepID=C1ASA8_RHOOB|nr:SDR family oxidoreductase [Rhodococcus opacus]BAH48357.1 putative gluconate 5-dehydrogenase [Rhodococcus opacus B4]
MPISEALAPDETGPGIFDLTERRVIVTGASRGLGRQLARGLAAFGASVACVARDQAALDETVALIEAQGGKASAYVADLGDPDAVTSLIERVAIDMGGIDVLLNNAGVDHDSPIEETSLETWEKVIEVNNRSVFLMIQAASPYLRASGGYGKVINIASILGTVAMRDNSAYVMSKHAAIGLTKSIALEWGRRGVQVNALCPGFLVTDMTIHSVSDEASSKWITSRTPMGRWGQPSDYVGAAVFLASRASDFMTGQTLYIDGGWTAQ